MDAVILVESARGIDTKGTEGSMRREVPAWYEAAANEKPTIDAPTIEPCGRSRHAGWSGAGQWERREAMNR